MDPTSATGARIANRFELVAPISDLGVAEAWSARDLQGGEARVTLLGATTPQLAEPLGAAAAALRGLSNPGIVTTLDLGAADGRCYAVSEPFDGRSLANWLEGHRQAGTRPGFGVAQRLFDRVASALQAAHTAGVVHGALSPRCVVLKRVGAGQHHVRVTDFALGPFAANLATTPTWFDYQAPEQRGPRPGDGAAVDVFAAAVILAELLTLCAGPRPEARETWGQFVREAKAPAVTERLVALRGDVPRGVWEVVAGALAASPRERGASLQRLQRGLREAWSAVGEWDRSALAEPDPPAPDPSRVRALQPAAPQKVRTNSAAIEGWQSAERARASAPSWPSDERPRVATAVAGTPYAPPPVPAPAPVYAPATVAMPLVSPDLESEVPLDDATEAIDLEAAAAYLQQLHDGRPSAPVEEAAPDGAFAHFGFDAPDARESTRAIDAAAFFEQQQTHSEGMAVDVGTAVRAQGPDLAAAIAAAGAAQERPDESTRMLDVASPESSYDPRGSFTPWTPGAGTGPVPDPYGASASGAFGVDDPFADNGARGSIPPFGGAPSPWAAPPQGGSPFGATLKSVPRNSIPSAAPAIAPAPAPTPEKLWGAAPPPTRRPAPPPPRSGLAPWQLGVIVALVLGLGAAVFLALGAR